MPNILHLKGRLLLNEGMWHSMYFTWTHPKTSSFRASPLRITLRRMAYTVNASIEFSVPFHRVCGFIAWRD